ncbi:CCHC-type domain-containing protein [Aphis craccivora]|uniref:CCHC-type domain-containing protein n=1 Tax=Aphis craccivora TaxID=307492 RepID=A0A6G0WNL5_APHCR|nr:CCHC-type domain-containing protein [Aphis craccivora]
MARTATANEDLLEYALKEGIDIALLQEPYARYHKLAGFEVAPLRIILTPGVRQMGGYNVLHGAAIVIFNPALTVISRNDLTCDNFAVASVSLGDGESINLISTYFKYNIPINTMISKLQEILQRNNKK